MAQDNPALIIAGTLVVPGLAGVYRLMAQAVSASVITLEGAGLAHTDRSVARVVRALQDFASPPVLIGHSQGGLVAAIVAQRRPGLVAGVITLGAPLAGTCHARTWMPLSAARCMAYGSRYLEELRRPSVPMVNIVGEKDVVVVPQSSGFIEGADHYSFEVGHTGMIFDDAVIALVAEVVRDRIQSRSNYPVAS